MSDIDWSEVEKLVSKIAGDIEGKDYVLKGVLKKLGIGVATKHSVIKEDELICDPIIWVAGDLESVTKEEWFEDRAYKTLSERSIEEGQQIRSDLEWMINNGDIK